MYKILLINSPVHETRDYRKLLPLGINYLASTLKNAGYICKTIDGMIDGLSIDDIVGLSKEYDMAGVSSTTRAFPYAVEVAQRIKQSNANMPVVLGGYHATFEHHNVINQYSCFDAVMRGEGETAFVDLCKDYFKHGSFTEPVKGVSYRRINDEKLFSDEINLEENLNKLAFPVRDSLLKYQQDFYYKKQKKIYITLTTSRGCPFGCSFCATTCFRRKWLPRTAENVAEEVYLLYKEYKDIFIAFIDDNFYIDSKRAKEIIIKMNEKCGEIIGFNFGTRADQIIKNGPDYLQFFKDNGCRSIELGIENGSNTVLKRYCKNNTADTNRQAIQMIRNQGIQAAVDYIMFDPKISLHELQENAAFLKKANLWGEYVPILYNRVEDFPGTMFQQIYGDVSTEHYFEADNVKQIYDCLIQFKTMFQERMNVLIDGFLNCSDKGVEAKIPKIDYVWLRTIPYELFDKLVGQSSDYFQIYNLFLEENKLEERITYLEAMM